MSKLKTFALLFATSALVLISACAPAATPPPPTADTAMMAKETDTAMMAKETDTAMMAHETNTAMMAKETESAMMAKPTDAAMSSNDSMMFKFPSQQFAAHFVDSMPMHEATLEKIPAQVVLNFNFTLSDASTITLEKDGKELKTAPGKLGDKKLSMTTEIPPDAGAGLYLVKYKACWPDSSCHDGQFAFAVK
mgnify:CR=1 FL=1